MMKSNNLPGENTLVELIGTYRDFDKIVKTNISVNEAANINENFKKLLEFVDENYINELYLKDLACKFYINFTYCCELFRKVTGTTFSEYITELRMKKARELLKSKGLTISQVSNAVGYSDYYYFNKVFKKMHGVTPLVYKDTVNL